jgi:hypothetical protein
MPVTIIDPPEDGYKPQSLADLRTAQADQEQHPTA